MPLHPLTDFDKDEINDAEYVINIDEYKSMGTHWKGFYVNDDNVTYFDSFGVEYIPKEIEKNSYIEKI